jgi:hypothetical protein
MQVTRIKLVASSRLGAISTIFKFKFDSESESDGIFVRVIFV